MPRRTLLAGVVFVSILAAADAADDAYRSPPEAVKKILDAPPTPSVALSPDKKYLVFVEKTRYPSIEDLARPTLRLAGIRIDPATSGPERQGRNTAIRIKDIASGKSVTLALPEKGRPDAPDWSPDAKSFALTVTGEDGIALYVGEPTSEKLRLVPGVKLSGTYGDPVTWLADSKTIAVRAVPATRGAPPEKGRAPTGPVIQETSGKAAPVRTYQDLLANRHDEALFDHYFTSQITLIDAATGKATAIGRPAVYGAVVPSPDGKHLLVMRNVRPYSYSQPASAFPKVVEVWDAAGKVVHEVAKLPLADNVPIEGVPTGRRSIAWRPDVPATLVWVEALDGGDPRTEAAFRDIVYTQAAPFTDKPVPLAKTQHRFASLSWGEKGFALLGDYDRDTRRRRVFTLTAGDTAAPKLLFDRSIQDRYNDPGSPLTMRLPDGKRVLRRKGDDLFLVGAGATPKGERPFIDRYNIATGKATRLFQSKEGEYENVLDVMDDEGHRIITRHESPTSPPNLRIRDTQKEGITALTEFEDKTPELRKITRKLVKYKRADGVPLSFTLYLPPDYKEGTRLPTVVWAYPREFTDASVAGQVAGSPDRYTVMSGTSHLFFLLAGYAVLDGATMPVVGTPEKANDTFVEQIVSSAKAAIDQAVEMGVTDRDRVGVAGHSYGAFMTANLLAHSDLFRAGIARSGAYNRTLTPFGFQSERRTLWEAPKIYADVSPFMVANKINEPILIVHGQADNNPGTFPIQSERLYQAVKGNGGTARLVMLPHESHGYQARESVGHVLAEMIDWFDKHVKTPKRSKE